MAELSPMMRHYVELKEKYQVELEFVPVTPLHDLRQIKGKLADLLDPSVYTQSDPNDYLRVILTDEEQLYDPMGQLRRVYPNIMRLDLENSYTKSADSTETAAEDLQMRSPLELFAEFYAMANGVDLNKDEEKVVASLMEEMAGEGQ